ncbi:MAG: phosphatidylglycerol lysyltransferase domain-containing protein [Solirubrobacteraceae bacterium]
MARFSSRGEVQNGLINRFALPTIRQWATLSVALVAGQAVVFGIALNDGNSERVLGTLSAAALIPVCLASLLVLARGTFVLGSENRPRIAIVSAAIGTWGVACSALMAAQLIPGAAGHTLRRVLHPSAAHALRAASNPRLSAEWTGLIEVLIACAALTSVLAVRALLRPMPAANRHFELEEHAARSIVKRYGRDSLSPFLLRPDKALAFAAGGVLSYRLIGGTAVVSADPVAPEGGAPEVLERFLAVAHQRGWRVVVWGASHRHLDAYRGLGLRTVCAGEEAVVDPQTFTLEGRPVRKLRQSVNRVSRRGWQVDVCEGREINSELEAEIEALEADWRARQPKLLGFAMGMGGFEPELRAEDLFVLGRSPEGQLGAVMRFAGHCGNLSLDTMRRVPGAPNGLNEALVARALTEARERGVAEVSLNYAGLAHLVRDHSARGRISRRLLRAAVSPLYRHFQMERLVRFNEKFSPQWRPRYLVYESRAALPGAILRVLQAEGYLTERRAFAAPPTTPVLPRALAGSPRAKEAG